MVIYGGYHNLSQIYPCHYHLNTFQATHEHYFLNTFHSYIVYTANMKYWSVDQYNKQHFYLKDIYCYLICALFCPPNQYPSIVRETLSTFPYTPQHHTPTHHIMTQPVLHIIIN